MEISIEFEREIDGRWIAEALGFPGTLAYGTTRQEAEANIRSLVEIARKDED